MIYKATKLIAAAFDAKDIKYSTDETDTSSYISAVFTSDKVSGLRATVRYISKDNDNDVALRIFDLVKFPDEKRDAALRALNACSKRFRYLSFSLDEKNNVDVSFDFPLRMTDDSVGPVAVEMFLRCMNIIEDVYPTFMKVIWA